MKSNPHSQLSWNKHRTIFFDKNIVSRFSPAWVFNMDETWISARGRKVRVIVPSEWATAPSLEDNEHTLHITLIFCVSADGAHAAPTAILPKVKYLPGDAKQFLGWFSMSSSDSGWINTEIFDDWVKQVFIPHIEAKRIFLKAPNQPALLYLDGHSSRNNSTTQNLLKSKNVYVVTIPPHTSHVLQPLDRGVNRAFKQHLRKYMRPPSKTGTVSERIMLLGASVRACHHAFDPTTIQGGFKEAGLVPWDPDHILNDPTKVTDATKSKQDTPQVPGKGPCTQGVVLVNPSLPFLVAAQYLPTLVHNHGNAPQPSQPPNLPQ